jgi:hypothetical protein
MAGVTIPTFVLMLILTVYAYNRFYFEVSSQFVIPLPGEPLDRAIVFPMAVVPNMWGVWNMLYLALRARLPWSARWMCSRFNGTSRCRWHRSE